MCFAFPINGQVVINEVSVKPGTNATSAQFQSLKDCANPTFGNEYIELYNTNSCTAIDISCYVIATPYSGISVNSQGAFRFPAGTTIPPLGFVSIGGAGSGATFILPNYCTGPNSGNLVTGGTRWFLDNFDQYVALYNASGTPVNVVYWTTSANQSTRWNNSAYDGLFLAPTTIPNPSSCGNITSLAGPSTFPLGIVNYAGAAPALGTVLERTVDGGSTWATNATPTLNACNGTCVVANLFTISATTTQPTCGNSNGSITITPSPAGNYTYNWLPNVSANGSASNLAAGSYDVTVSLNGCQKDTTITLNSTNGPTAIAVNTTNASCGQSNGSATLGAVTGGTGPYQYNFNNQGFSNTGSYSNLAAGSYTLIVRDNLGCTYTAPNIAINTTNGPTAIAVNTTNASCGQSNGSATLGAVTGGTGPYQYNFNNQGFSNTGSYSNLAAGSYTLIVRDNLGCTYTAPNVVINTTNGPTAIAVTVVDASCGQDNGSVTLGTVTGGTGPYQYNFNNQGFSNTGSYNNLAAGSYTLIVRDNLGCTYTAPNMVINAISGPTAIAVTVVDASCGQSNGSVTLGTVTGGTGPYQYDFNNQGFSNTGSYSNLAAGSYTLIVRDNLGCTYTAPNAVINNTNGPTAIALTSVDASCGQSNGSVTLGTVTGGTGPYQYDFNNQGFSNTTNYPNLSGGNFTIVVRDNNNCIYNTSVSIQTTSAPTGVAVTVTPTICSNNNGSVVFGVISGGTAPYLIDFDNQGASAQTSFNNLSPADYTVIITDVNSCSYTTQVTVGKDNSTGPQSIIYNTATADCGAVNGAVEILSIVGGTAPYAFNFNNTGFSTTSTFVNLAPGNYPIQIQDDNGCVLTDVISIEPDRDGEVVFAPNSFTPNGDNQNDEWFLKGNCIKSYTCSIFNRWGEKLAVLNNLADAWDGIYGNIKAPQGIYVYIAEVSFQSGDTKKIIGHINLIQ